LDRAHASQWIVIPFVQKASVCGGGISQSPPVVGSVSE
jgi:hypothetical protein